MEDSYIFPMDGSSHTVGKSISIYCHSGEYMQCVADCSLLTFYLEHFDQLDDNKSKWCFRIYRCHVGLTRHTSVCRNLDSVKAK